MQLSTRVRYGMMALLDLARRRHDDPVRAADIAAATGISRGYLEGLLAALRRAGVVRAVRGPGGGWRLARPASRLRPADAFAVLEGGTALVPCAEDPHACDDSRRCGARRLWVRMGRALDAALRLESVAQLAGLVPAAGARASTGARRKHRTRAKARARVRRRAKIALVARRRTTKIRVAPAARRALRKSA